MRLKENTYYICNYKGLFMIFRTKEKSCNHPPPIGYPEAIRIDHINGEYAGKYGWVGAVSLINFESIEIPESQVELYKVIYGP